MKKVLIWGTGAVYNRHVNLIKYMELSSQLEVAGIITDLSEMTIKLDGYLCISKQDIHRMKYDYILIMSDKAYGEIVREALDLGVASECLLSYKVLDIPYFDFEQYIRLRKSRFTIISNNCWGGIVYNSLSMECLSPFKNLFLEDKDYIRLLKNLKRYLALPLRFVDYGTDIHSGCQYPIMCLGDVAVHCNHDTDPEVAAEKWNRRLKKVNYENLFVEMYTSDNSAAEAFVALQQYAKKICFVPFEAYADNMVQLKLYPGQNEFWEIVNKSGTGTGSYKLLELLQGNINWRVE